MARQYVLHSLPFPVFVNETGTRQEVILTTFLNETVATSTPSTPIGGGRASGSFSRKRYYEILAAKKAVEEAEQKAAELDESKRKTAIEAAAQAASAAIAQIEADDESAEASAQLEAMARALDAAVRAKKFSDTLRQSRAAIRAAEALAEIEDEEETITLLLQ